MGVSVDRCTPDNKLTDLDCASEGEIDEFINKLVIGSVEGYDVIDYSKRGPGVKPTNQMFQMQSF